ncbi:MAG: hypothetical protein ACR2NZ_24935 [Rubripirellula sp.]
MLLLLGVGIVGTLWLAGVPLNPFATDEKEDPYMVRIPINAQAIPAYTRVNRSYLLNPANGGLMFQRVPPQAAVGMSIVGIDQNGSHVESRVESVRNDNDKVVFVVTDGAEVRQANAFVLGGAILNVSSIIGRVVKSDKRAGLGFQESTFFPQGTPEGLAGATPIGMRAITLDATRLTGVHSLNAGDVIDLMASIPVEEFTESDPTDDHEVQLLAQSAHVLRPVYVRNEVTSNSSLMNGQTAQNIPKYEVAIAVSAEDVIPLQEALNHDVGITCVAHSMKPADENATELITRPDVVTVPITVRPILAYQVVSRDAFVSPATRTLRTETISRQVADRIGAITSLHDALGAITKQDIPTGHYLRHSDLLKGPPTNTPEPSADTLEANQGRDMRHSDGSTYVAMFQQPAPVASAPTATAVGDRPAITRFIPAGRTAFAIPLNRIYGAEHLQIGDTIDLMASYSLEQLQDEEETETRPDGTVIVRKSESLTPRTTRRSWEQSLGNRAEPWFVASDAIVVAPVGFPAPAAALRAIEQSDAAENRRNAAIGFDGPPIIIAVASRDVESMATAMATRDALFTVAFHASETNELPPQSKSIAVAPESLEAFTALDNNSWMGNRRDVASRVVSTSDPRFSNALAPEQLADFYGRVLKAEKPRGAFFTADDFLPVGTGAGIAAVARVGFTLLPIADREIEGIDSFVTDDRVTILIRAVVQSQALNRLTSEAGIATSVVVADSVRIARGSLAGQSVLEIRNEDLTRLQAALARSLTDRKDLEDRSHLIAVGIARQAKDQQTAVADGIPEFDPLQNIKSTELIIGGRRSFEVFGGQQP